MRKTVLLLASTALTVLLTSGVALAFSTIRCDGGVCKGTPKSDKMLGSSKRDIMYSFKGDDKLFGRAARDDLYGFEGRDEVYGQGGNDELSGGDGGDYLDGSTGSDFLNGGNSADSLAGDEGDDRMFGGPDASNDLLYMEGGDGTDLLDGGKGNDTYDFEVDFSHPGTGWHATISDSDINPTLGQSVSSGDALYFEIWWRNLTIDLSPGPGPEVTDATGKSTIQWSDPGEFYKVTGGVGDDTITGDEWPNVLLGYEGVNTISGGGSNDILRTFDNGGSQSGGEGDDTLEGYRDATLRGDNDNDRIYVGSYGEADTGATTYVEGGTGNDNIEALNDQPDMIDCGDGTDTVTFDAGLDKVTNCEN